MLLRIRYATSSLIITQQSRPASVWIGASEWFWKRP